MDVTIKGFPLKLEEVTIVINEILSIDIEDNIDFQITNVKDIRSGDEYGGFKITIVAKLDTFKNTIAIELTTGDTITPREMKYNYTIQ